MNKNYNIILVLGPTASGKTKLAVQLAHYLKTEIISADSRQVYRDMNIGTGKDYEDYFYKGDKINCHLIDIAEAGDEYNVNRFIDDFYNVFEKFSSSKKIPILCGGTGMYFDALLQNYEYTIVPINENLREELKDKTREELLTVFLNLPETSYKKLADTSTTRRLIRAIEICTWEQNNSIQKTERRKLKPIIFGLNPERELRRKRIKERLDFRLKNGLVEEVRSLLDRGINNEKLKYYGLEYKYVTLFIEGALSFDEMQKKLTMEIQRFAKRQMTFFRKMEREGLKINWIDASLSVEEQLKYLQSKI